MSFGGGGEGSKRKAKVLEQKSICKQQQEAKKTASYHSKPISLQWTVRQLAFDEPIFDHQPANIKRLKWPRCKTMKTIPKPLLALFRFGFSTNREYSSVGRSLATHTAIHFHFSRYNSLSVESQLNCQFPLFTTPSLREQRSAKQSRAQRKH